MKTIRSLANTRSTLHRILFTLGFAGVLIAGLLAMHTLSTGDTRIESAQTASGHGQDAVAMDGEAVDAGHCAGDCGAPDPMPDHSMAVMVCALALLAVVVVVLAPALLARLSMSLNLAVLLRDGARASAPPRPPSLLVLSISRT